MSRARTVRHGAALAAIAAALGLDGLIDPDHLFGALAAGFTVGGAIALLAALWRRDALGRGRLDGWARCLSFNAVALAMRLLRTLFAQS